MDYGRFIGILKGFSADTASEARVWNNINRTLEEKRNNISLLSFIWPRLLVTAAALTAIFVIYFVNYEKQLEARNFVQRMNSTEYIYETCKYDGL
jgi:Na+/H+ antiporter NhaD/arsenite permease-like protein